MFKIKKNHQALTITLNIINSKLELNTLNSKLGFNSVMSRGNAMGHYTHSGLVVVVGQAHTKGGGQFGAPPQKVSCVAYFWPMIGLELSRYKERGLLGWEYTVGGCKVAG
jgi:hypothetical protein